MEYSFPIYEMCIYQVILQVTYKKDLIKELCLK